MNQPFGHPHQPQPAPSPPQKSKKGLIIGCCSGCLVVMAGICGTGGYLAYLEEGIDLSSPGEEIAEAPFTAGQPFALTHAFDGRGWAHHDLWLVVTGREVGDGRFQLTGTANCEYEETVAMGLTDFYVKKLQRTGSEFTAWMRIADSYTRSGETVSCTGIVNASEGEIVSARLVLTEIQRPSDWLDF